MVAYIGMTPEITPKLLISNMILELMIPYDKVGNGYGNGSINKLVITCYLMWCYHQFMEFNWWSLINGNRLKITPWVVLLAAPCLNNISPIWLPY